MKVRISFTVDIDADMWAEAYGLEKREVRPDVQTWAKAQVMETLSDNELIIKEAGNESRRRPTSYRERPEWQ